MPVTCTPASGSTFPLGATTVSCSATDKAGNTATGTFAVTVQDKTPPVVTVPADMTVDATGPSGAVVTFTVSALDLWMVQCPLHVLQLQVPRFRWVQLLYRVLPRTSPAIPGPAPSRRPFSMSSSNVESAISHDCRRHEFERSGRYLLGLGFGSGGWFSACHMHSSLRLHIPARHNNRVLLCH